MKENNSILNGRIEIFDGETNEMLVSKDNIFLEQGREYILDRIFNLAKSNLFINMFRIGDGGAPMSNPFSPTPPSPTDKDLYHPIPFQVQAQPDPFYPNPEKDGNLYKYMYKKIDMTKAEKSVDPKTNTIFMHLKLYIDTVDSYNGKFNELGLVASAADFSSPVLFSKVTFDTETLSPKKSLIIHYYVYA